MAIADDPWEPPKVDPGTVVYHYTSPVGLVGVMQQRELWASEATSLNDLSEVKKGLKAIRHRVREELEVTPGTWR